MKQIEQAPVTTKIILETRVTTRDRKHPVKLRVTYQRERKYYTILKKEYKHLAVKEFKMIMDPQSRGKNKEQRQYYYMVEKKASEIIESLPEFSFESFESAYRDQKKNNETLQELFESKIQELMNDKRLQTAFLYRSTLNSLLAFNKNVTLQKITVSFLNKFQEHLIESGKTYTTVAIYMRHLRHILKTAMKKGLITKWMFGKSRDELYQIPEAANIKKSLSKEDIKALWTFTPKTRNRQLAKQYWFFSYLANGMNMADILNLKYKNFQQDAFEFVRKKTERTSKTKTKIRVLLRPELKQIIEVIGNKDQKPESFVFPVYSNELTEVEKLRKLKQLIKFVNKYMKQIAFELEINQKITTYAARHSFSTILKRSDAPIDVIKEQLGHKDVRTTEAYLKSFEDETIKKYNSNLL